MRIAFSIKEFGLPSRKAIYEISELEYDDSANENYFAKNVLLLVC